MNLISIPGKKETYKKYGLYAFIMALPFLVFYWQVPFLADRTIGNDYVAFPIYQQLELQYSLKHGSFPLYVPGYAGGQSSAALTLGQIYHPISHLASVLPGYWGGNALQWNTLLRLLLLGLAHLGLFILLVRLRLTPILSFIISFITVYNMRMLDLFHYGASLENYTGYLFLCTAMAFYYIKPTRFIGPASIIASTYLLVCGGHPQMMYLGLLGASIAAAAIPFVLGKISEEIKPDRQKLIKYFKTTVICLAMGILLSSAYIIPYYFDFVLTNAVRVGQDYQWSLAYSSSTTGMLNSFFVPLRSEVQGAFGSSSIILLVALVPLLYAFRIRVPIAVTTLWAVLTVLFLCSLGSETPLHYYFWNYFPLAKSFRIPGRITMIFPFLFLLILAWLFARYKEKSRLLALIAIPLFLLYNWVLVKHLPKLRAYLPEHISAYPQWVNPLIFWLGLFVLILVVLYSFYLKSSAKGVRVSWPTIVGVLLSAAVVIQVMVEFRHGTWIVKRPPQKTLAKMDSQKKKALTFYGDPGFGLETAAVSWQKKRSILEPALAKFYRKYRYVPNQNKAYRFLGKENAADTIVLEAAPNMTALPGHNSDRDSWKRVDRILLKESSFNRVVFSLDAGASGFLAVHFPYSHNWRAMVDGDSTRVYRANGYMLAVYVGAGQHQVEFRYWSSAALVGMLISCLTFLLMGGYFAFFVFNGKKRIIAAAVSILIPACLFFTWYTGLYSGDNLGTRYTWSSQQFPSPSNLAYAKRTSMSSAKWLTYAGLGVDGVISKPFKTHSHEPGWWQVDLGLPKEIGEIVIYSGRGSALEYLPLEILGSINGKTFKTLKTIAERGTGHPWRIPMSGETARFLRLQSSSKTSLSFREVEIYPPGAGFFIPCALDMSPQKVIETFKEKHILLPGDKEIKVWNKNGHTVEEISPPLITFGKWGKFKIDPVEDNGIGMVRVCILEPNKKGIRRLNFGYGINRRGLDMDMPEGKTIYFIVNAAISSHLVNNNNYFAVRDFDGRWESSQRVYFVSHLWNTYIVSKKVRPGISRLILFISFNPQSSEDEVMVRDVRIFISK
ncbi:MAG: YfhO family protein [Candidatus Aminicenantes bacterium]|nr:YfhO family protein [Candidatus Aminicenantes bacterium]NIM81045.1 YfhO family protein [Candidatus Aminicenantes bacterium]NIN20422.1 YfhO family protein [Candidatus Aminicenantes bacterium]NIN44195.1 YfhO family protein [Candidatus Aminicenantes bacterium]NIN87013.1 YfhO family protein [Candidatus Aminicenantes bacterium]